MAASRDPTILAFDTSGPHCAVALLRDDAVYGDRTEPMARGQAERLFPMIEALLTAEGVTFGDLDVIGAGTGPGSFTGTRITVAAARGLALALGIPAVGVSMFEVMAHMNPSESLLVSLPGSRDSAYVQPLRRGRPSGPARQIDPERAPRDLQLFPGMHVLGWRAETIGRQFEATWEEAELGNLPYRIALIAEWRVSFEGETPEPPRPLYLRGADAAPPREAPPPILD